MKKIILLLLVIFTILYGNAQYNITIKIYDFQADSLTLNSYNAKTWSFEPILKIPYQEEMHLIGKQTLHPGYYVVTADSFDLASFFISNTKNQKFTLEIWKDLIQFTDNEENKAYLNFRKKETEIHQKLKILDEEFAKIQKSNMPAYMKQTSIDSLAAHALTIINSKHKFIQNLLEEQNQTLFASYLQSQLPIPEPPKSYYNNKNRYTQFLADTLLTHFPWHDERFFSTPFALNILRDYAKTIIQLPYNQAIISLKKTLTSAAINPQSYFLAFDFFEKMFGDLNSPFRSEPLYQTMLQHILAMPTLEKSSKVRYEFELSMIHKNKIGDTISNFPILLSTGDTTSIYQIPAEYMLIYFQNPNCPTCIETRQHLQTLTLLNQAIEKKKIKVVTIYFEDDENIWRQYLQESANPKYIHGWNYSLNIEKEYLFDTRVIPMMIIVDNNKRVIAKDIHYSEIESFLQHLGLN